MHTNISRFIVVFAFLLTLALAFGVGGSPVTEAASVPPQLYGENVSCKDLGYQFEVKFDSPPTPGTMPLGTGTVSWNFSAGDYQIDWSSVGFNVDAVIVKGGPVANVYRYSPPSTGDTALVTPTNPNNNQPYGLSHVSFCYNVYQLTATKTASGSYTRTYSWSITKEADANYTKFIGDPATTHPYTVSVDQTITDSPYVVSGTITVTNPAPYVVSVTVSDVVNGTPAIVTCPDASVPAGGQLVCNYSATLGAPDNGTNVATITSGIPNVSGTTAQADFTFTQNVVGYSTINVIDDQFGPLGPASGDTIFPSYNGTFTCPTDPAQYTNGVYVAPPFVNTATIVETGQSDTATVNVTCYAPVVSKNATAEWRRKYDWTITKTVDPETHIGFAGDSFTSDYEVTVDQTITDYGFKASGTILVTNPHPTQSMNVSLVDVVNGATADLDCGGNLIIGPGQTEDCIYTVNLPDNTDLTNTATVTFNGINFLATALVDFGDPIIEGYPTINVTDSVQGPLGSASKDETFTYSDTFACSTDQADYTNGVDTDTYPNTAKIVETNQEASENVTVTCYAPVVTKTADESFTRTYTWNIEKVGDQTELTLSTGQTFTVNYDVTVSATFADSDWAVSGTISVANPHPSEPMTVEVSDVVSPGIAATVDCDGLGGTSLTVPAATAAFCSYNADLPDASDRTNTATATLNGGSFTGNEDVIFGGPTTEVDECIDVTDDQGGPLGTVCYSDLPKTFEYTLEIGPYEVCGEYTFVNVASFVTNDTGATGNDDHTVTVDVPCEVGCTLTQGYWKTHSEYGPARWPDDTWLLILPDGPDTTFYLSGQTYLEVMRTPPAGNAYYNLASQYIAAKLNVLSGASTTAEVDTALASADALFQQYTPTQIAALKGNNAVRKEFISLASTLDRYNNGLIGPGHCDEDSSSG